MARAGGFSSRERICSRLCRLETRMLAGLADVGARGYRVRVTGTEKRKTCWNALCLAYNRGMIGDLAHDMRQAVSTTRVAFQ